MEATKFREAQSLIRHIYMKKLTVLYINFASKNFDGATYSLLDLIESVKEYVNPIVLLPNEGDVAKEFRKRGIECLVHDFEENITAKPVRLKTWIHNAISYIPHLYKYILKNKACIKWVSKELTNRHIDIVHTNNSVLTIGYMISKCLNVKHVWHLRGYMDLDFGWNPFMGWSDLKKKVADSDAVIGITRPVLEHYVDEPRSNAYAISDAVRSIKDIDYDRKENYFLFCSAYLTKRKGTDFAIRAFYESGVWKDGTKLRVIGKKIDREWTMINDLVQSLNLNGSIDFIDFTNDIKSQMIHAKALLMCSENEGLGRVSIEAMFYGCPVIGRNSGGTSEIIKDRVNGYLYESLEECSGIINEIANGQENKEIIDNAHKNVIEEFSIENYSNKILGVYQNLYQ